MLAPHCLEIGKNRRPWLMAQPMLSKMLKSFRMKPLPLAGIFWKQVNKTVTSHVSVQCQCDLVLGCGILGSGNGAGLPGCTFGKNGQDYRTDVQAWYPQERWCWWSCLKVSWLRYLKSKKDIRKHYYVEPSPQLAPYSPGAWKRLKPSWMPRKLLMTTWCMFELLQNKPQQELISSLTSLSNTILSFRDSSFWHGTYCVIAPIVCPIVQLASRSGWKRISQKQWMLRWRRFWAFFSI